MFESGLELVIESQSRSIAYQRFEKVRGLLYAVANMNQKRLASWSVADILDFVIAIDESREEIICDQTLMGYYRDIRDCFRELDINTFYTQERALKCAMNLYRQELIKKLGANIKKKKPNLVKKGTWRKILQFLLSPIGQSENDKAWNRVVGLCLTWCLTSGARVADVLNLKIESMTEVTLENGDTCWTVDINEGKSNRYGNRESRVVLYKKPNNFIFCPMENYWSFYDRFPDLKGPFCISNPDDPSVKIKTSQIMTRLGQRCKVLGLTRLQTPDAHSMRVYFVNHALERGISAEKIAQSVNWSSSAMISHYMRNTEFLMDAPNRTIVNEPESDVREAFIPRNETSFHF